MLFTKPINQSYQSFPQLCGGKHWQAPSYIYIKVKKNKSGVTAILHGLIFDYKDTRANLVIMGRNHINLICLDSPINEWRKKYIATFFLVHHRKFPFLLDSFLHFSLFQTPCFHPETSLRLMNLYTFHCRCLSKILYF